MGRATACGSGGTATQALSNAELERTLRILEADLRTKFGLAAPRILVAGLNPHAGEGGHMGREEIELMQPLLERLRGEGMRLIGPLPADTLYCHPLDAAQQLDKAMALRMQHDLQTPLPAKKCLRRMLQRLLLGRRWPATGEDEFLRKAVRRHEVFWVREMPLGPTASE